MEVHYIEKPRGFDVAHARGGLSPNRFALCQLPRYVAVPAFQGRRSTATSSRSTLLAHGMPSIATRLRSTS